MAEKAGKINPTQARPSEAERKFHKFQLPWSKKLQPRLGERSNVRSRHGDSAGLPGHAPSRLWTRQTSARRTRFLAECAELPLSRNITRTSGKSKWCSVEQGWLGAVCPNGRIKRQPFRRSPTRRQASRPRSGSRRTQSGKYARNRLEPPPDCRAATANEN